MTQTEFVNEPAATRRTAWLRPAVAVAAIGWGANQFAQLIIVYRQHGVSTTGLVATGSQQLTFAAFATTLPAFVGVLVQPVIGRLGGDRQATAMLVPAMGVTVVALGIAIGAAAASTMWAVLVAEVALGAAYGVTQFAGLANIQQIAPPALLGHATSAYQALAYVGFAVPYLLSLAHAALGWSPALGLTVVTAAAIAATLALLASTRQHIR